MNIGEFIKKLQTLPDNRKKLVFFAVMGVCAIVLFFFAIQSTKSGLAQFSQSTAALQLPVENIMSDERDDNSSEIVTTPIPAEKTANVAIYKNEKYGFLVQYPLIFSTTEYPAGNGVDFNPLEFTGQENDVSSIGMYMPKTTRTFKEWIKDQYPPGNSFGFNPSTQITEEKIHNYTVWKFVIHSGNADIYHTFFENTNNMMVDVYYAKKAQGDYQDIYQQMLSTFTFNP